MEAKANDPHVDDQQESCKKDPSEKQQDSLHEEVSLVEMEQEDVEEMCKSIACDIAEKAMDCCDNKDEDTGPASTLKSEDLQSNLMEKAKVCILLTTTLFMSKGLKVLLLL